MKALISIAALAAAITVSATSTQAAVIAQFSPNTNAADYRWIQSGGTGKTAGTGGHFFSIAAIPDPAHPGKFLTNNSTTAQAVDVHFGFLAPTDLTVIAFVPAKFTIDATVTNGHPASVNGAGVYTETDLNGSFSFIYSGPTINNYKGSGINLIAGSNLLSGVFTDAWIQGAGGSGSTNLTTTNGGTATFTSAYIPSSHFEPGTEEFAMNMLSVSPKFSAGTCTNGVCKKALASFRANGGGNYSGSLVPEPSAWALMIVGFGAAGAMIRSRRRLAAAA